MARTIILTLAAACVVVSLVAQEPKHKPRTVRVSDIGDSIILIGRLGKPLGEKMVIRGKWSLPKESVKDSSPRFTVTSVDERSLETPVEFNLGQMRLLTTNHRDAKPKQEDWKSLDSVEWQMTAYETGYSGATPDEYREENPVFPQSAKPYYTRWFTSELVAVRTQ